MSNLKFSVLDALVSPSKAIKLLFTDSALLTLLFTGLRAQHVVLNSLFGKSTQAAVLIFALEKFQDEDNEGKFIAFLHTQLTKSQSEKLSGSNVIDMMLNVCKKGKFNIYTGEKLGETKVKIDSNFIQLNDDCVQFGTYAKYLDSLDETPQTSEVKQADEVPQASN